MNNLTEILNSGGEKFIEFAAPMLIQSSVLIVILLAVDLLLRKKVRATFRYWLWMLVLVKLVLPPTFSSPVSFGRILGDKIIATRFEQTIKVTDPAAMVETEAPAEPLIIKSLETSGEEKAIAAQLQNSAEAPALISATEAAGKITGGVLSWQAIMLVVWVGAAGAMVLLVIQRLFFVIGLIRQAQPAQGLLTETFEFCCKRMGVTLPIRLKISANATSPAVCGLFRPVVLVPQDIGPSLGVGHLRPVLMHELGHIKRGDLWVNLVQTVLQIIYFYNPLLWLANAVIRRIREQAVDEMVQVAMGERAEQYPETLVSVAKLAFGQPALALRFIGVVESKSALKGRIKKMLNQPIPKTAKLGLAGLAAIIIAAAVLLPMAAGKKNESGQTSFTATLSSGATVELMGTCQYTAEGADCFRPDGMPMGEKLRIEKWNQKPKAGDTGIMLKVSGPEDISFSYGKIQGAKGWEGSCQVVDENGRELAGWEAALTRFDSDQKTTSMTFGVAAGDWTTVAEHDGRSMGIDNGISFTKAVETEKGVQIYTTDTLGRDVTQRIVAIDNDGKLHPWKGSTGSVSNSEIRQSIGTFPNLKLDQIKEFQFQTRPYQWVEFKNVSLKPGHKTDVQIEVENNPATEDTEILESKTALLNDVSVENHHKLLMERRDILQKILQDVELKYDAGRANSRELQDAKIDLLKVESELAETPEIRINILNQIVTMYLEQEKTTKLLLEAGRTTQVELDKIKLLRLEAETELAKAMEETKERQANLNATEDPGLTEKKLKELVEDFFNHNYRDITARRTIEWGKPQTDENGNVLIRYKYEATIWGKDKIIEDKVWTFDRRGNFLWVRKAGAEDIYSLAGAQALIENFFANNYRDITARKTIEWGEPVKDENSNVSIRYKYEATIWGKDKIIDNKIFTFDKNGKYVSAVNVQGFPQKLDVGESISEAAINPQKPAGKLEFRIVPNQDTSGQAPFIEPTVLKDYTDTLLAKGPDDQIWGSSQYYSKYKWVAYGNDAEGTGITVSYNGKRFGLLCNEPKFTMLADHKWGLQKAYVTQDGRGEPAIKYEFDTKGGELFYELTGNNIKNRLAIIIDDEIYSAPQIVSAISREGIITGNFSQQQAEQIAENLQKGMSAVNLAARAEGQEQGRARTELAYDDGTSAGKWTFSGGGHGVKFTGPAKTNLVTAVRIYGSRYGEFEPPDENFDVWICDESFNIIENFQFPYSTFEKRGYEKWATLEIEPTKVRQNFAVCVAFDPHQTKGIYMYYDAKDSGHSYQGIPPEMKPFKDGDWLIRVVVQPLSEDETAAGPEPSAKTAVQRDILANDDGKSAGKWSFSGGGHGVKFTAPAEGCILKAVKLYGSRYGEYETPKEDFDVWLCDKNFNIIKNFKFPYSTFAKRGYTKWATLKVDDVELPKEFAICMAFDPHQTKGIYVYHDAKSNGLSYQGIPPEMEPFKDGDWMIRAIVETPGGKAASGTKPSQANRMEAENLASDAWKLWAEHKLAEAEDMFRQAVEKDPTNANAWNGLGWSQQNQGKKENARYSFERCLELEPKHAAALNGLGWIAKSEGKTDDAIEYWKKAVRASDGNATASLSGLTQTYMELGKYDEAVKYYQMWLKVEPNNEEVKDGLAKAQAMRQK